MVREIPSFSSVSRPDTGGAPISLDTCFVQFTLSFPIINRRKHTVVGVLSGRVVEHLDVIEHVLPCSAQCGVGPSPDSFPFQKMKEAFCHRIVMTIPAPAHARIQIVFAQKRLPSLAGELSALIGMN